MKRWMLWVARGLGALALLGLAIVLVGGHLAQRKMERRVLVDVKPVAYASGEQAVERGRYLFLSRGCTDCHGATGAGRDFIDKPEMKVRGPNITPGGLVANYQPEDWVRVIRHGVKPDGRPAIIMPSEDYNRLTDEDLAALVAYVRSLPAVKGGETVLELPMPVRVMYGFGAILDAAERIDHTLPPSQPIPAAVNAQHGAYVANACIGCHGEKLGGGKVPGGPPDWPAAANLTPGEGSAMGHYPNADAFVKMLRTGKRPDGSAIQVMPFESLAQLNDVDAQALYVYLKTVPPRKLGER